jgi:hypothetical protein
VSRWETGATTPDGNSLAAIYSIAMSQNVVPDFFQERPDAAHLERRTKLVLAWDFQSLGLEKTHVKHEWGYMQNYLDLLHPGTRDSRSLRAYTSPEQKMAGSELETESFEVYEGEFDADSQLIRDTSIEIEESPEKTVFVLVSDDGNYAGFLKELRTMDVDVYVWTTDGFSDRLRACVDGEHIIRWNAPYVIMTCMNVIRGLNGEPVNGQKFSELCRTELLDEECYPEDVGFSRRTPYRSLLRWLENHGIVEVSTANANSESISIKVRNQYQVQ